MLSELEKQDKNRYIIFIKPQKSSDIIYCNDELLGTVGQLTVDSAGDVYICLKVNQCVHQNLQERRC